MYKIYKYQVDLSAGEFEIEMPKYARILCVREQENKPYIWAEVNTDEPLFKRKFVTICTGQELPIGALCYIGTFQVNKSMGPFVGHFYEKYVYVNEEGYK